MGLLFLSQRVGSQPQEQMCSSCSAWAIRGDERWGNGGNRRLDTASHCAPTLQPPFGDPVCHNIHSQKEQGPISHLCSVSFWSRSKWCEGQHWAWREWASPGPGLQRSTAPIILLGLRSHAGLGDKNRNYLGSP